MSPAWCRPRWRGGGRLLMPVVMLVLMTTLVVHQGSLLSTNRRVSSPVTCRPDMMVNALPPMADDDLVMTRDLFSYLTRPSIRTCRRVAKLGGVPRKRSDGNVGMDGHSFICLDDEFSGWLSGGCLVYSAAADADWSLAADASTFGCHVVLFDASLEHGIQQPNVKLVQEAIGAGDEFMTLGRRPMTLERALRSQGHDDVVVQLLKLDLNGAEWDVLRQQVQLGQRSALFRNIQQLTVNIHLARHVPVSGHIEFYRDVYSILLGLQSFGFFPFSYEPNYMQDAAVTLPGLGEVTTVDLQVAWVKTVCVDQELKQV